jgi:hypothetical protein
MVVVVSAEIAPNLNYSAVCGWPFGDALAHMAARKSGGIFAVKTVRGRRLRNMRNSVKLTKSFCDNPTVREPGIPRPVTLNY